MCNAKVFYARMACPSELEEKIDEYIQGHPGMMPQSVSMAANDSYIYATVIFNAVAVFPIVNTLEQRGPYGPIGPDYTKKVNDDPWKGEFIPVGDPPIHPATAVSPAESARPVVATSRRNVMEQFGASYH